MAGVKKIVPVGKVAGVTDTDSARGFFSWHALGLRSFCTQKRAILSQILNVPIPTQMPGNHF
jgi:hypothetical protein